MARITAIFQPIFSGDRHSTSIMELLSSPADDVTVSVAFVREEGVNQLAAALAKNASRTRAFVGVRNGVTTAQGVNALLKIGVVPYAVDTGYGAAIFHPKFYAWERGEIAKVIIGSANVTFSGLNNNIEASALIELNKANVDDEAFLARLLDGLKKLRTEFRKHCYRIKNRAHVEKMTAEGLLEDEAIAPPDTAPRTGGPAATKPRYLERIGLKFTKLPKRHGSKKAARPKAAVEAPIPTDGAPAFGALIWEKPKLPEGDLQLLTQGHISGVLRLTQAKFKTDGAVIDQTTYFRKNVFGALAWAAGSKGKEVATGKFALVISGVYLGSFNLSISHKAAWESGQGNYTTGLHWGEATPLIRKPELVGRTLRLYRPAASEAPFVIEID